MKTARSIAEQEERKAAKDNRNQSDSQGDSLRALSQPVKQKHKRGDESYTARIAPYQWKKGVSANPGGKPKVDLSAEIARGIFENNKDVIYAAFVKMLKRGNAYAYQVLADRGYGKLKESHTVEVGRYPDMSDADLKARVTELEAKLGYAPALPPAEDRSKPN